MFYFIGILGILVIGFMFWLIIGEEHRFDTSLLGVLTLGISLIVVSIFKPNNIKVGDVEILKKVEVATVKAEAATDNANKSAKLAKESIAVLMWNSGRLDSGANTETAKKIMLETYGKEEGEKAINYYIQKGIFKTTDEEKNTFLKNKKTALPSEINSPYIELMNKENIK